MPYDIRNPSASDDLPISGPLAPRPINQPEQIHLAYGGSTPGTYGGQQSMYVSWNTGAQLVPAVLSRRGWATSELAMPLQDMGPGNPARVELQPQDFLTGLSQLTCV